MSSIPAPNIVADANQISQNPLAEYARATQLGQEQQQFAQEQQQRQMQTQMMQQQLNDQKAMTAAMQQWDGKDFNELPDLMRKNGISGPGYLNAQNAILARRQQLATLDKEGLENMQAHHDAALGVLQAHENVPDDQLIPSIVGAAQELASQGHISPQEFAQIQQHAQSMDGASFRPWLGMMEKSLLGEKAAAQQAIQDREASAKEEEAGAAQTKAGAAQQEAEQKNWQKFPELGVMVNTQTGEQRNVTGTGGMLPPGMLEAKYIALQQKAGSGQPLSRDDAAFVKAYKNFKTLVPVANFNLQNAGLAGTPQQPSAIAQAIANGTMKWQDAVSARTPATVKESLLKEVKGINPNFNSGDFALEQGMKKYMETGKGGQQLTAFNTALNHLDLLDSLSGDLNNTNVQVLNRAKQRWATETGNPAPVNFQAAVNAMSGEVASAMKASGATDSEIEKAESTFSRAQSPAQLHGAINTYRTLLKSKAHNLQQQYQQGMQGQPNFGAEQPAPTGGAFNFNQFPEHK